MWTNAYESFSSLRAEQLSKPQGEQNSWPELSKNRDAMLVEVFSEDINK